MNSTKKRTNQFHVHAYFQSIKNLKKILIEDVQKIENDKDFKKTVDRENQEHVIYTLKDRQDTVNRLGDFLLRHKDLITAEINTHDQFNQDKKLAKCQRDIIFSYLQGVYPFTNKSEKTQLLNEGIKTFLNTLSEELKKEVYIIENILYKIQQLLENKFQKTDVLKEGFNNQELLIFEKNQVLIKIILKAFQATSTSCENYRKFYTLYSGKYKSYIFRYLDSAKLFNKNNKIYLFYLIDKNASDKKFKQVLSIEKEKNPLNLYSIKDFNQFIENLKEIKSSTFIEHFLLEAYRKRIITDSKIALYFKQLNTNKYFLYQIVAYQGITQLKLKTKKPNNYNVEFLINFLSKINLNDLAPLLNKKWFINLLSIALTTNSRNILLFSLFKEFNKNVYSKIAPLLNADERGFHLRPCLNRDICNDILLSLIENKLEINIINHRKLSLDEYKTILDKLKTSYPDNSKYSKQSRVFQFKKILPTNQYNSFFSVFTDEIINFNKPFLSFNEIVDLIRYICDLNCPTLAKVYKLTDLYKTYCIIDNIEEKEILKALTLNIILKNLILTPYIETIDLIKLFQTEIFSNNQLGFNNLNSINCYIFNEYARVLCLDSKTSFRSVEEKLMKKYVKFISYLHDNNRDNSNFLFHKQEKYIVSKFNEEYKALTEHLVYFLKINKATLKLSENDRNKTIRLQNAHTNENEIKKSIEEFQKKHTEVIHTLINNDVLFKLDRILQNTNVCNLYLIFYLGITFMQFQEDINALTTAGADQEISKEIYEAICNNSSLNTTINSIGQIVLNAIKNIYEALLRNNQTDEAFLKIVGRCFTPFLLLNIYNNTLQAFDPISLNAWCELENASMNNPFSFFGTLNTVKKNARFLLNSWTFFQILSNYVKIIATNIIDINLNNEKCYELKTFTNSLIRYFADSKSFEKSDDHMFARNLQAKEDEFFQNLKALNQDALRLLIATNKLIHLAKIMPENKRESMSNLIAIDSHLEKQYQLLKVDSAILKNIKTMVSEMFTKLLFQVKNPDKSTIIYFDKEVIQNQEISIEEKKNDLINILKENSLSDDEEEGNIVENCGKYANSKITIYHCHDKEGNSRTAMLRTSKINNKTEYRLAL